MGEIVNSYLAKYLPNIIKKKTYAIKNIYYLKIYNCIFIERPYCVDMNGDLMLDTTC